MTEWRKFTENQRKLENREQTAVGKPKLACIDILNIGGFSDAANRFVTEVESVEIQMIAEF